MAFRLRGASALAVGAVVAVIATGVAVAPTAIGSDGPDGKTAANAGPSCWAIKQNFPESTTGLYWLKTARLGSAQQFYCDMVTDGGGWVLVGRGRESWNFHYAGQGTARQVRETPEGTGAFQPAALSGDIINGLFNGNNVQEIRLRRAKNSGGTSWQDVRWLPKDLKEWTWTFDGGVRLDGSQYDTRSYGAGLTSNEVHDNIIYPYNRVWTTKNQSKAWKKGFAHGSYVSGGSNSASTYLWTNSNEGSPIPFTQVWVRPRVMSPDAPLVDKPKLLSGKTSPTPWGVTGVVGGGTGEANIEVQGLAVLGDTVYVGGKFQYVQKGATPGAGEKVEQSYLAAFDANTGEWKPYFRPKLNGTVWDVQAAGDKIIVAGDFTNVNGAENTTGLAALSPSTGEPVATWKASLARGSSTPRGRALDVQDGWLYVGGTFTHVKGGTTINKSPLWVGGAARVKLSDGTPDTTFNPFFDGGVYELDASPKGDRVYFGGRMEYMGKQKETRTNNFVVTDTQTGKRVPGVADQTWTPSTTREDGQYRQTVLETTGGKVWMGGSEHDFQLYSRDFDKRINGHITRAGGDFQDSIEINGVVYAGSHGFDFDYSDASTYPDPITGGYSTVNRINMIGAYDAETGKYLAAWNPVFGSRAGNGVWAFAKDNNGCMWVGGDMKSGSWVNTGYQWLGGFGRFCPA